MDDFIIVSISHKSDPEYQKVFLYSDEDSKLAVEKLSQLAELVFNNYLNEFAIWQKHCLEREKKHVASCLEKMKNARDGFRLAIQDDSVHLDDVLEWYRVFTRSAKGSPIISYTDGVYVSDINNHLV